MLLLCLSCALFFSIDVKKKEKILNNESGNEKRYMMRYLLLKSNA